MSDSRRPWPPGGASRAILAGALALGISGCQLVKSLYPTEARPVEGLAVEASGGVLIVTWSNPVDFRSLRVEVLDENGRPVNAGKASPATSRLGPAMTAVRELPPGTYRIEVVSDASDDGTKVARAGPAVAVIPEPVKQYIGLADLGLSAIEDLEVVTLIHPRMQAFAGGDNAASGRSPMESTFRQVAANVLSEVFRSAIPIQSGADVLRIEREGEIIAKQIFDSPIWLLNPAAVMVVDCRRAGAGAGGQQLHARLLDLRLARLLKLDYAKLDLRNTRALVVEGYAEIGRFESPGEDMVVALRDAWGRLLREILASPRYGTYKKALEELRPGGELPEAEAALVQSLFFGAIPEALWPYRQGAEDPGARVRALEQNLFFRPIEKGAPAGGAATEAEPAGGNPPAEKREGTP